MLSKDEKLKVDSLRDDLRRLSQKKAACSSPYTSYYTEANDPVYMDASRGLSSARSEIAEILIPYIIKLRNLKFTWKSICDKLEVPISIIRMCRSRNIYPDNEDKIV